MDERQNLYKVVDPERTLDEFNTAIYNSNEGSFTTFDFHGYSIRVTLINGDPWFVASDIAQILGYRNAPDMTRMLNEWEVNTTQNVRSIPSRGNPNMTIINEPGLYHCIFNSRRPEAIEFQNWVYTYVLPSVRQYGAYVTSAVRESLHNDPSHIVELERQLSEYQQKVTELQENITKLKGSNQFRESRIQSLEHSAFHNAAYAAIGEDIVAYIKKKLESGAVI